MVDYDQGLKELGVRHFKKIFSDDNLSSISAQMKIIRLFPSFLSQEDRSSFTPNVSLKEVETTLKYFKKDKVPKPDGFPVEFFLAFFDLLGE